MSDKEKYELFCKLVQIALMFDNPSSTYYTIKNNGSFVVTDCEKECYYSQFPMKTLEELLNSSYHHFIDEWFK